MDHAFLDPGQFDSDEDLVDYILEAFVKPVIAEHLGEEVENDNEIEIEGLAYVFGGDVEVDQQEIMRLHSFLGEGLSPEYVINEMTDFRINRRKQIDYRGFTVHYIEIADRADDISAPSAEDLQAIFDRSPNE